MSRDRRTFVERGLSSSNVTVRLRQRLREAGLDNGETGHSFRRGGVMAASQSCVKRESESELSFSIRRAHDERSWMEKGGWANPRVMRSRYMDSSRPVRQRVQTDT